MALSMLLGVGSDGAVTRLSTQLNGRASRPRGWRASTAARAGARELRGSWLRISTTTAPATSSPPDRAAHESRWPLQAAVSAPRAAAARGISAAADLDGDGRLELVGAARRRRRRGPGEGAEELSVAGAFGPARSRRPAISGSIRSALAARSRCERGCTSRSRSSPRRSCTSALARRRVQRSPASRGPTASCSRSST